MNLYEYDDFLRADDRRTCSVVEPGCKAPPALTESTKAECFSCGLPVCTACSSRRQYLRYGVKRVCLKCQEQYEMKGGRKFKSRRGS